MKQEYVLQFQSPADPAADLLEGRRQEQALRKFVLKRELLSFSSRVNSRIMLGKPRGASPVKVGMQGFISEDNNCQKVEDFLNAAGCERLTPADFAAAADKDYNDIAHNNTDDVLESDAQELMAMGAVQLLKSTLPLPCLLVEHFSLVKKHLFG